MSLENFDVIVVGSGHAGIEASLASARMGLKTACITLDAKGVGRMPCNPAIGGPAKSHIVFEIDALGGEMGKAADANFMQMKMLNLSKGPAVWSLRAQVDRHAYVDYMCNVFINTPNLSLIQDQAESLVLEGDRIVGIKLLSGAVLKSKAVVITSGTFLKGVTHCGFVQKNEGRRNESPALSLSDSLKSVGIHLGRLKTGTTPRLKKSSIDFSKMEAQPGSEKIYRFSADSPKDLRNQELCYLTYTSERTHELIRNNLHQSPLYSGVIHGIGPRYCPSIEDKVMRFPDKLSHQIFIEPESYRTDHMYTQGFSTSFPAEFQQKMLETIPGLERAEIIYPGYAVEYDFVFPSQLKLSLESKEIQGLFFAGQICGTSGYEEAAGQGMIAGINAAQYVKNDAPLVLKRSESYIGTMIDDLVHKEIKEPYRMMTARSEYRLSLRQDNADERLIAYGRKLGLISDERYFRYINMMEKVRVEIQRLRKTRISNTQENVFKMSQLKQPMDQSMALADFLKRPEMGYSELTHFDSESAKIEEEVALMASIQIKYDGYIKRQMLEISKFEKLESAYIPKELNYLEIKGLRVEAAQKLNQLKPGSIGQASRIAGVNPADMSVLMVYVSYLNRLPAQTDKNHNLSKKIVSHETI